MLNTEYIEKLKKRLPNQLQGYEYLFLNVDIDVEAEYYSSLEKYKVKKAPLVRNWNSLPLEKYTLNALKGIEAQCIYFNNRRLLDHVYNNKLNPALLIKSSPYCIIDIDSASINLERLKLIKEYASKEKEEIIEKFLNFLDGTYTVSSGNNGFHHYFYAPEFKQKYSTSKTKCLNVSNLLTEKELKNYNNNVKAKFKLAPNQNLDIDFLSNSSYIIIPPSSFNFKDKTTKANNSNYYKTHKDLKVNKIDEEIILSILDLNGSETKNKGEKKSRFMLSLNSLETIDKVSPFSKLIGLKLQEINENLYHTIVSQDEKLKSYFDKARETDVHFFNYRKFFIKYQIRLNTLIQRDYHDQNGYRFLAHQILEDYNAMNYYAENKAYSFPYNYFSNVFECLKAENYSKADRSSFEYAFVMLELAKLTRPEILWEIIQKEFSPKTKVYDKRYFTQLLNKIKSDEIQIDSTYPMSDIFQFYLDSFKIDYRYYFDRSANSCASVFLALIDRAIKIGRNDKDYWTLTFESCTNIGLMAHVDRKTASEAIEKLSKSGFIYIEYNRKFSDNKKNEINLLSKFYSITINKHKKFKTAKTHTIIPHVFVELQHIVGIGKTGSMIYTLLLDKEPRTLTEIYKLFPGLGNPYNNIKPRINFLTNSGLLEYNPEDKTYISSTSKLYSKLLLAKEMEFKIKQEKVRKTEVINNQNSEKIFNLKSITKSRKQEVIYNLHIYKRDVKLKPLDTNYHRAYEAKDKRNKFRRKVKEKTTQEKLKKNQEL